MGIVTSGVPEKHVALLRELGGYDEFVETGTHMGDSARWAAERFRRVQTIEAAQVYFDQARERLSSCPNVALHLGRSQDVLRALVPALTAPALFWLDAHWSALATFGAEEQCPLIAEIQTVLSGAEHAILIDDARLFLRPPGGSHDWRQWPHIDDICRQVRESSGGSHFVTVVDDVIYCLPRRLEARWCEHLSKPAPRPSRRLRLARRVAGWIAGRKLEGRFVD